MKMVVKEKRMRILRITGERQRRQNGTCGFSPDYLESGCQRIES
jgi:hypothetical protein